MGSGSRSVGRLEVVAGPMFAGKTEELLRRVRRASIGGRRVQVFTHALDARDGVGRVVSHVGREHASIAVASAAELEGSIEEGTDLVAVDEAHFFGADLVEAAGRLAGRGIVVIVAGLSVTFDGGPFEPVPSLMAVAERVDKLTAVCALCGEEAVYHARVEPSEARATELVGEHVGGAEKYQARCRRHVRG